MAFLRDKKIKIKMGQIKTYYILNDTSGFYQKNKGKKSYFLIPLNKPSLFNLISIFYFFNLIIYPASLHTRYETVFWTLRSFFIITDCTGSTTKFCWWRISSSLTALDKDGLICHPQKT